MAKKHNVKPQPETMPYPVEQASDPEMMVSYKAGFDIIDKLDPETKQPKRVVLTVTPHRKDAHMTVAEEYLANAEERRDRKNDSIGGTRRYFVETREVPKTSEAKIAAKNAELRKRAEKYRKNRKPAQVAKEG